MNLAEKFPPLYECSVCGKPVDVLPVADGEPVINRRCEHDGATVWANRKVTLYGKGDVNIATRWQRKITLSVRQLLSALTGRSI
jgi:endogenous inhibitor of DNA gyrase (YacG/DUF329 family)